MKWGAMTQQRQALLPSYHMILRLVDSLLGGSSFKVNKDLMIWLQINSKVNGRGLAHEANVS